MAISLNRLLPSKIESLASLTQLYLLPFSALERCCVCCVHRVWSPWMVLCALLRFSVTFFFCSQEREFAVYSGHKSDIKVIKKIPSKLLPFSFLTGSARAPLELAFSSLSASRTLSECALPIKGTWRLYSRRNT